MCAEERPFAADAVFIPDNARRCDSQGEQISPEDCVLLMVDGDNYSADVFTKDAWKGKGKPFCRREHGEFTLVEGGKVELLPELWIVKIDERNWWTDADILAACPRICGVYVFDRKQHFHICSTEACYELHFLGSQYEEANELQDDEHRRDEINGKILEGDAQSEQISYWGRHDVDRMLQTEIQEGFLPPEGKGGGYRLTGIASVTAGEAIEEARESHCGSPL
jgi:hypothetical protein